MCHDSLVVLYCSPSTAAQKHLNSFIRHDMVFCSIVYVCMIFLYIYILVIQPIGGVRTDQTRQHLLVSQAGWSLTHLMSPYDKKKKDICGEFTGCHEVLMEC